MYLDHIRHKVEVQFSSVQMIDRSDARNNGRAAQAKGQRRNDCTDRPAADEGRNWRWKGCNGPDQNKMKSESKDLHRRRMGAAAADSEAATALCPAQY